MALNYDFDMFSVIPKAIFDDPALGGFLGEMGFTQNQKSNYVALFRDPATVAALQRAPQGLQDYLRASEFGFNTYHSGAPAGRYPDTDDAARIMVIEMLAGNVGKFDLPRADDSQPPEDAFHLPAFFAALVEAQPISMPTDAAPPTIGPAAADPLIPPRARGRFQLPKVPRWMMAGAAFAVLYFALVPTTT